MVCPPTAATAAAAAAGAGAAAAAAAVTAAGAIVAFTYHKPNSDSLLPVVQVNHGPRIYRKVGPQLGILTSFLVSFRLWLLDSGVEMGQIWLVVCLRLLLQEWLELILEMLRLLLLIVML
jgi:hypothetical protein